MIFQTSAAPFSAYVARKTYIPDSISNYFRRDKEWWLVDDWWGKGIIEEHEFPEGTQWCEVELRLAKRHKENLERLHSEFAGLVMVLL